jgi:hypothetical protein
MMKEENKLRLNILIFTRAILIVMFFYSVSGMIRKAMGGTDTYLSYIIMCTVPVLYFLSDDGLADELIGGPGQESEMAMHTAAGVVVQQQP